MAYEQNLLLFEALKYEKSWTLDGYRQFGGYQAWEKILREQTPREKIIDELKASGLRGRGGAAFPTGVKWSFMPRSSPVQKYAVCNSDESEPGTCHDRGHPALQPALGDRGHGHRRLLDDGHGGLQLYSRRVSGRAHPAFRSRAEEAYAAGLLGKNILGSGVDFDLHMFVGAGAYICGEETALLESLEGKPGKPRFKPPFPANFGLYGKPTTINNTQSYASVPTILRQGRGVVRGPRAAELRRHHDFFRVRSCRQTGEFRIAAGYSLQGSDGSVRRHLEGPQAQGRDSRRRVGTRGAGRGHVGPPPWTTIRSRRRVPRSARARSSSWTRPPAWYARWSAFRASTCRSPADQCTPCREGTGWLNRMLKRIIAGQGRSEDITLLVDVANRIEGHTICALATPRHGRCRVHQAITGTNFNTWSNTRAAPSSTGRATPQRPWRHRANDERRSGQYRSQRRAIEGPQGSDDHAGHRSCGHLHSAILLPR